MTDQTTRLVVGKSDGLPDVLNRLKKAAGTSVALEIPDASSLFLTASEFRALQAAADRDRITITVTTDDPLRQQLAALFKLPVAAPVAQTEPAATEPEAPIPTTPAPDTGTAEKSEGPAEEVSPTEAPSSVVSRGRLGARRPRGVPIAAEREETTNDEPAAEPAVDISPEAPSRLSRAAARLSATTTRQRLIALGALVGVVVLAYLGAYLFLTRATVVLTLKRQPISRQLSVAVAAPGATAPNADLTVAATPVNFDVTTSQSMNVTGSKTVGDATAQGKVSLSNPTNKPVTIDAGTQLEDKITGTKYAIAAAVALPAGKDGAPGFGEAAVTCLEPGTVGNRDIGLLSGRLSDGVYFSNREGAIAGGTDKQIPVVAQADLDALQAKVVDGLKAQAAGQQPGVGQVVLPPSVQLGEPSFSPDHRVGDEAATLTVQATAHATALAYSPSELHDRIADTLAASAPDGYQLDRSSLQLSDPTAGDGNAQAVLLTLQATGSATAIVTSENENQIAAAVAGGDEAEAKAYLAGLTTIDGFAIRYSPGWLPHRIPSSTDRVRVETR